MCKSCSCNQKPVPPTPDKAELTFIWAVWAILAILLLVAVMISFPGCAVASERIDTNKLANSIYIAEGGTKTRHPYGILAHYKHTTPRQACLNTINSALKRWNGEGDFIVFLGNTYSPPLINPYWVKNVKYYYGRG